MIRKAMVFPNKLKRLDAFNRFKVDYPDNMYFLRDYKVITANCEITFLEPDNLERMRGQTFHEVVIVDKVWLTRDELNQLQMTVVPTGGSFRSLK